MYNIGVVRKEECTGCSSCANICPQNCIKMVQDDEGFLTPNIQTDLCTNCGLCIKRCPIKYTIKPNSIIKGFAVTHKDKSCSQNSASGGVFMALAKYYIEVKRGYVCGSVMDQDLNVQHIVSNKIEDICKMQRSKYTQSDVNECFKVIKNLLLEGKDVLFSGTPCQVAGLFCYLGKIYENLLSVDLICHGVPSQVFFRNHINRTYKLNDANIKKVTFRDKNKYESVSYRFVIDYDRGIKRKVYATDDAYFASFIKGNSFRESCYNCIYATNYRVGDITIGDCANKKSYRTFSYGDVLSTVLINTNNGKLAWKEISDCFNIEEADIDREIRMNTPLNRPKYRDKQRDEIYKDYEIMPEHKFSKKYKIKLPMASKIKRYIKSHISLSSKESIKNILRRFK